MAIPHPLVVKKLVGMSAGSDRLVFQMDFPQNLSGVHRVAQRDRPALIGSNMSLAKRPNTAFSAVDQKILQPTIDEPLSDPFQSESFADAAWVYFDSRFRKSDLAPKCVHFDPARPDAV